MEESTVVLLAGIVSAAAVVVAAHLAPLMAGKQAHRTKVSEFRQEWINAFRDDMAEFLTASERVRGGANQSLPMGVSMDPGAADRERLSTRNDLVRTYHRMYLRINPQQNDNQEEDATFLRALGRLLNSDEHASDEEWQQCRRDFVHQGRALLKREWERAKKGD